MMRAGAIARTGAVFVNETQSGRRGLNAEQLNTRFV
jgi:hypothetical protein